MECQGRGLADRPGLRRGRSEPAVGGAAAMAEDLQLIAKGNLKAEARNPQSRHRVFANSDCLCPLGRKRPPAITAMDDWASTPRPARQAAGRGGRVQSSVSPGTGYVLGDLLVTLEDVGSNLRCAGDAD